MFRIYVPDMNDSMSLLTVDDVTYFIRFTYNSTYDCWSMGLYTDDGEPLIPMVKMVPFFDLLQYYDYRTDLPDGHFVIITRLDKLGRDAFLEDDSFLVYISNEEIEEAEAEDSEDGNSMTSLSSSRSSSSYTGTSTQSVFDGIRMITNPEVDSISLNSLIT